MGINMKDSVTVPVKFDRETYRRLDVFAQAEGRTLANAVLFLTDRGFKGMGLWRKEIAAAVLSMKVKDREERARLRKKATAQWRAMRKEINARIAKLAP